MTNELAEEYRELKRNLIPILLQTCGKERLCDAVDKWLLVKSGIKVISKSWYEGGLPGKEYVVIKDTYFIKEISGKVYVKAGTDSVDVINLQTRRTKRYKVQYT